MGTIVNLPAGSFETFGDNELLLKSSKDDPPKFRQESPGPGRSLGCFSFGRNGGERVLVEAKLSEDGQSGEFGVWCFDEARGGTEDNRMGDPILYITSKGINVKTDRMTSADGRFVTVQQGDGNFVTYDTQRGIVGDPKAAIWSAWTGVIG